MATLKVSITIWIAHAFHPSERITAQLLGDSLGIFNASKTRFDQIANAMSVSFQAPAVERTTTDMHRAIFFIGIHRRNLSDENRAINLVFAGA